MKGLILLDRWEVNGQNRVEEAEELILQLPKDNPARNAWLFKYGISEEAVQLRATNNPSVNFNEMFRKCDTGSLNTPYLDSRIITVIADLIEVQTEQEEPLKDELWFQRQKIFVLEVLWVGFTPCTSFLTG